MSLIRVEQENDVAVLILDKDVTNPMSRDLLEELHEILDAARRDTAVNGLVLASSTHKFLSIGLDLPGLIGLSREEFESFYTFLNRTCMKLYAFPKPTVAAITGHAIAGGCILALCCDYRIIAEGRKLMGLNEVKLGVPVPYPADRMLHQLVGTRFAREIMESGEFYEPGDSFRMGLVDGIVPPDEVLPQAIEKARQLGALPAGAFRAIKQNRVEYVEKQIMEHLPRKQEVFIDCWFSPGTRLRLKEASKRF